MSIPGRGPANQPISFMASSSVPNFAQIKDGNNYGQNEPMISGEDRIKMITQQGRPEPATITAFTTQINSNTHTSLQHQIENIEFSDDFKLSTKPAIAQAAKPPENSFDPTFSFINQIEYASVNGANRKRKKPVP